MADSESTTNARDIEFATGTKDFSTTDPSHHDPANFRYVVHAINPDAALGLAIQRGQMSDQSGYEMDEPHPPLTEPDKFARRAYISASVIDQDHLGTWGGSGFILEVAPENILVTSPTDAGTIPAKQLDYLQRNAELMSFPELLNQTDKNTLNEIVLDGSGDHTPVRIIGVFVKYWFDGTQYVPVDKRTAWKVEAFASPNLLHAGLPIIEIRLPKTDDSPLEIQDLHDEYQTKMLRMGKDGKEFSIYFSKFPWADGIHIINFINHSTANDRSMTAEERLQFIEELSNAANLPDTSEEMRTLIQQAQEFLTSEEAIKRDYFDPVDWETELKRPKYIEKKRITYT